MANAAICCCIDEALGGEQFRVIGSGMETDDGNGGGGGGGSGITFPVLAFAALLVSVSEAG
jgi:hypothetical protein